ncbi:predicted protein [Chaetomium globosum CBS 148.51]|uniref:Uncharacterized protein n=1 Tax=Chaetomium globosum (strain ATCC 6205 / CBS 148.51 / DSM 1962 / NBRC 6347 / NRRL 1970) TaxID=306901 RepID=Q2GN39_CHAGB|nr:uncharacterized protein CHGG_10615 [Chaetomium globosum CBS 148.51]EAQ84211.1 predicted protein [Chaetomium globosum CBS 148.51]
MTDAIPTTNNGAEHAMEQGGEYKRGATWIKRRGNLTARPTWKELFDYGSGCCKWVIANNNVDGECFTRATNNCYVATLCYHHWDANTDKKHWEIFHSTIPRTRFFDLLWDNGNKEAPIWHAATKKCRGVNRQVHAEDGVLYCFEREHKRCPGPGQERLRIVVQFRQQQQQQPRPGTAGSGKSGSTAYGSEVFDGSEVISARGMVEGAGPPNPKPQPPAGGSSPSSVAQLTRGMSALSVGRHGPVPPPGHPASRPSSP